MNETFQVVDKAKENYCYERRDDRFLSTKLYMYDVYGSGQSGRHKIYFLPRLTSSLVHSDFFSPIPAEPAQLDFAQKLDELSPQKWSNFAQNGLIPKMAYFWAKIWENVRQNSTMRVSTEIRPKLADYELLCIICLKCDFQLSLTSSYECYMYVS
jgi:hypothetical protein